MRSILLLSILALHAVACSAAPGSPNDDDSGENPANDEESSSGSKGPAGSSSGGPNSSSGGVPTAPDAPSEKPSLPICMSGYKSTGTHNCSNTEADNYIDQINKYMKILSAYAADAIVYANGVQEYAKCSAEEAKEGLK